MNRHCPIAADASPSPVLDGGVAFDDLAVDRCTSRMVEGDRNAFEELFRRRCRFVEAEARRRLGRRGDLALDVAGETWIRVARGPRRCDRAASLDAWLRRIVRSAAIDLLRSELSRREREEAAARNRPEAVAFLDDLDLLEQIRRDAARIDGLSNDERTLFELLVRADGAVARIAGWLGLGTAAVDSRLRRAARRARDARREP
jgi:RNA polymerase sigma-70 factor (ECF subfamily)